MENNPAKVIKELQSCLDWQAHNIEIGKENLSDRLESFKKSVDFLETHKDCPYCFLKFIEKLKGNLSALEIAAQNLIDSKFDANKLAREINWEFTSLSLEEKKALLPDKNLP
ncbi:MAG: hypothetical protein WA959_00295 [Rivularia sp. (in: cyanobacteria)]